MVNPISKDAINNDRDSQSRCFQFSPPAPFVYDATLDMDSRHSSKAAQGVPRPLERFTETRWSKVVLAGRGDSDLSREALEALCARYWFPIYSFIRRRGLSPHDAEDLTQQFFVRLLKTSALAHVDRSKGRFRNFLLGALVHFLSNESRKQRTQKRGGGQTPIQVDWCAGEERYLSEPDPNLTPEECYDRMWAATLLETAFQRLQAEFEKAGQGTRFEHLKAFLAKHHTKTDYEAAAKQLLLPGWSHIHKKLQENILQRNHCPFWPLAAVFGRKIRL